MQKNELAKVYDTMLSIPSMDVKQRLTIQLPLKAAFLLSKLIERSLSPKSGDDPEFVVLDMLQGEIGKDLSDLPREILEKTGLINFNDRLRALSEKHA